MSCKHCDPTPKATLFWSWLAVVAIWAFALLCLIHVNTVYDLRRVTTERDQCLNLLENLVNAPNSRSRDAF